MWAGASQGVPVYGPAFTSTYCAYPRRNGQAELTWVAGYIPGLLTRLLTVGHTSTNRSRCWLTLLMQPMKLPTEPNRNLYVDCTVQMIKAVVWYGRDCSIVCFV